MFHGIKNYGKKEDMPTNFYSALFSVGEAFEIWFKPTKLC